MDSGETLKEDVGQFFEPPRCVFRKVLGLGEALSDFSEDQTPQVHCYPQSRDLFGPPLCWTVSLSTGYCDLAGDR